MVKEKGNEKGKGAGKENGKAKGAGKENGKANGKAKAKEKSLNYLIRQDSPLPLPVPRKKSKPKVQIRKEKDFPNAPMGELICSLKNTLRLLRVSPTAPVPACVPRKPLPLAPQPAPSCLMHLLLYDCFT